MAYCVCLLILSSVVNGRLQDNPSLEKIKCASLLTESKCDTLSHGLCQWNGIHSICKTNYNPILFISAFELAATSKSLISILLLLACILLYWFSGLITRKCKIFTSMDPEKLKKCQIYIFQLIGLTLCLAYLLHCKTFNIIFHPDYYTQFGPNVALNFMRSLSAFVFLMYLYLIEMLCSIMRWSVQMHHIIIMGATLSILWIMDEYADLAALRCASCLSLYALTEHNVYIQLLLYRIAPLWGWPLHLASAILYLLTRLSVTGLFIYCYVDWAMTDHIANQFSGKNTKHYPYLIFFFVLPVAVIVINVAQLETVRALFYVSKSVSKKHKQRKELMYYPRLQALYDIFVSFDSERKGSWDFDNFRKFIYHYSSFVNEDTCTILWNVLGFAYSPDENVAEEIEIAQTGWMDRQRQQRVLTPRDFDNADEAFKSVKRRTKMKWRGFGKIFGQYVISKKFAFHSVETVVGAQVQILLQTVFDVQAQFGRYGGVDDKDQAIMKLYADIEKLVEGKKKKKTSTLPEQIGFKSAANGTTIEMILSPLSFIKEDEETKHNSRRITKESRHMTVTSRNMTVTSRNTSIGSRSTTEYDEEEETMTNTARSNRATDRQDSLNVPTTYRSTDAFKSSDDLAVTEHDWNSNIPTITEQDEVTQNAEEEGEEEEERDEQDMLFRILMHGPDGKQLSSSVDEEYEEESLMAHAPKSVVGTMQVVQRMLLDDDEINEWI